MKSGWPTENTIRQYLLGRFDDQQELESNLSQQMLFDGELSEIADSIEDEIIEDYLDGSLSAADKKAVDEYFLRPPQRREKLRFARTLRQHFDTKEDAVVVRESAPWTQSSVPGLMKNDVATGVVIPLRSHFRTYCEIAALVLLTAGSLFYISRVRQELQSQIDASQKKQAQVEKEFAHVREKAAALAKRLELYEPPVVTLSFFGLLRDIPSDHPIEIKPFTQRIRVEIDMGGAAAGAYDVRLETKAGEQIWSQTNLQSISGDLRFEMPALGITAGDYQLVVNSRGDHKIRSYWFRARSLSKA